MTSKFSFIVAHPHNPSFLLIVESASLHLEILVPSAKILLNESNTIWWTKTSTFVCFAKDPKEKKLLRLKESSSVLSLPVPPATYLGR
jgi:hypothetical protein